MRHTRLGIQARNDTDLDGLASAVRVTRVDPDGPGDRASLQVDDLVLAINGVPISRVSEVAYLTQIAGVGADRLAGIPRPIAKRFSSREPVAAGR
jgi:S1-C subfamily serine protease